ncbi:hypothetical protein SERLA73DRAFT_190887 [Serpula lacrymans var. lacrymans S7.3]|uniref:Uncharacterized protein n=2 Tax=Serpula lacrymans var. lacrymans TaxID=341189 RepID=F8QGK4_SERL3|nr:uncharacterized protein SERLADRAFT_456860 [Serpula lacrymans var. lacrymans S7.9]EGN92550.1 hypothetical protein SERLA73DRAFT_190887 [Serpula lacrymans var. lacrymans S7.3]EGO29295.1 hypothetical protein SERLADRAFT_456860 [Serpula lacrymans var. lacrymans S7.9]
MLQDLYPSVAYIKGPDTTSSQPVLVAGKVECLSLTVVKPELPKAVDASLNQFPFSEVIQSLSIQVNSCQAAMASLGTDLVTSERLKKQPIVQELYKAMKSKLITELHDLHTFLQEMTIFPDKLTHGAIAPDHPHHEILQAQISDISKEYEARCYQLIDTHTHIRIAFASNKDQFLKCIKLHPLRRRKTCPTIAKEKTTSSNSVLEVESALHNISVLLQNLHEFWKCRNDWCVIEQAILSSMKSIAGSLDSLRGSEVVTGSASPWHHRYFSART